MDRFGAERYVPIVLVKRGERGALTDLDDNVRRRITPLLVAPPIDWDYDADAPKKDVQAHLVDLPKALRTSWGARPAFIDLVHIEDDMMPSGQHPLEWVTNQARLLGLPLLPAVSPDRSAAYVNAAAAVVRRDGAGACLRLPVLEWPGGAGTARIDSLLATLGISAADAHLVLDLGDDTGSAAHTLAASELRALPYAADWRSVTVAGTAMPQTMPGGQGIHVLAREEWLIYRGIRNLTPQPVRVPSFGDYVISHLDPIVAVDPKLMNIAATLRYTAGDSWLIAKGAAFKASGGRGQGGAAMAPVVQQLVRHPDYFGDGHCGAEAWVQQVRMGGSGGNPEVWRRQGTLHHLNVVTEQLANLGAP